MINLRHRFTRQSSNTHTCISSLGPCRDGDGILNLGLVRAKAPTARNKSQKSGASAPPVRLVMLFGRKSAK